MCIENTPSSFAHPYPVHVILLFLKKERVWKKGK